jgi:hypothetical protein
MGTGVSPERVHEYRCQSRECSWVQISVHKELMSTGVRPQRVYVYRYQSREGS